MFGQVVGEPEPVREERRMCEKKAYLQCVCVWQGKVSGWVVACRWRLRIIAMTAAMETRWVDGVVKKKAQLAAMNLTCVRMDFYDFRAGVLVLKCCIYSSVHLLINFLVDDASRFVGPVVKMVKVRRE